MSIDKKESTEEQLKTENTQLKMELINTKQALIRAQGRVLELEYTLLAVDADPLKEQLPKPETTAEEVSNK